MLSEFKAFIMRGNVLDLAVGVIIGTAFTGLVNSLTKNMLNPVIGFFTGGTKDLVALSFKIGQVNLKYGQFLNDALNFVITAFVVFILVKSINRIFRTGQEEVKVNPELEVLNDIRALLQAQNK